MFNTFAHTGVDAIQTAKKQIVETLSPNEQVKKIATDFVDAQTQYTKSAIDAGFKAMTSIGELVTDRTPYVKLMEQIQSFFPTASSTKKAK